MTSVYRCASRNRVVCTLRANLSKHCNRNREREINRCGKRLCPSLRLSLSFFFSFTNAAGSFSPVTLPLRSSFVITFPHVYHRASITMIQRSEAPPMPSPPGRALLGIIISLSLFLGEQSCGESQSACLPRSYVIGEHGVHTQYLRRISLCSPAAGPRCPI